MILMLLFFAQSAVAEDIKDIPLIQVRRSDFLSKPDKVSIFGVQVGTVEDQNSIPKPVIQGISYKKNPKIKAEFYSIARMLTGVTLIKKLMIDVVTMKLSDFSSDGQSATLNIHYLKEYNVFSSNIYSSFKIKLFYDPHVNNFVVKKFDDNRKIQQLLFNVTSEGISSIDAT